MTENKFTRFTKERVSQLRVHLRYLDAWLLLHKKATLASELSNLDLMDQWLIQNRLPWSDENAVKAALALEDTLSWHTPPAKPAEVLHPLSDGSSQLPLNTTAEVLHKSTILQVKDWEKRKRAVSQPVRKLGSFSSKF
jgi:hypothetical protein